MSAWTHVECERCWFNRHQTIKITTTDAGDVLVTDYRRPVVLKSEARLDDKGFVQIEMCCWCGQPTIAGIYVRFDPKQLNCNHSEEDA